MCCLFGLMDYGNALSPRQRTRLVGVLARESEARGTDAAGIAYNSGGKLHILKRPGPARKLRFTLPDDARVVMGHTRMATQGDALHNRNNHPFSGKAGKTRFALAHNGVLYNDRLLRYQHGLPETPIETDSYVAVQLLEQQKALTPSSLKTMAEAVEGTFVFTILSQQDDLWFLRGENPLCLRFFPRLELFLYASTEAILNSALRKTWLRGEPFREIPVQTGDILRVDRRGRMHTEHFDLIHEVSRMFWTPVRGRSVERSYLEELKTVAGAFGYSPEDVERLFRSGWSPEEIEDALYLYQDL